MVSRPTTASQRFRLGDPSAELTPLIMLFGAMVVVLSLIPDLKDLRLSAASWAYVAFLTLIVVSWPFQMRWMLSPRRWYAELTETELVMRFLWSTLRVAYPNIRSVSRHDPGWRRMLAASRALFGRAPLPACIQVELREPIRRTLFWRTRRMLLRPHETALFLQTLHERAPTTPIVT